MGTNYYAQIKPTKAQKEALKAAIDNDEFDNIHDMMHELYGEVAYDYGTYDGGKIHLGKRSGGWTFLWNPNQYQVADGEIVEKVDEIGLAKKEYILQHKLRNFYDLNKDSIKKFICRDDVTILDEYGEVVPNDEFFQMAIKWGQEDGLDYDTYCSKYGETYGTTYDTDYKKWLRSLGYKINYQGEDFYSDGLRFATTTEFS